MYGSDPAAHADILKEGLLPLERAVRCEEEYDRVLTKWKAELGSRLREEP